MNWTWPKSYRSSFSFIHLLALIINKHTTSNLITFEMLLCELQMISHWSRKKHTILMSPLAELPTLINNWITHLQDCFGQSELWDSIAFQSKRPLFMWTRTRKQLLWKSVRLLQLFSLGLRIHIWKCGQLSCDYTCNERTYAPKSFSPFKCSFPLLWHLHATLFSVTLCHLMNLRAVLLNQSQMKCQLPEGVEVALGWLIVL